MSRQGKRYSEEFKKRMVELAKSGRNYLSLSQEFGVSDFSIREWVKKADQHLGKNSNLKSLDEAAELKELRREVRVLREERDILKKAAAWFAQETGTPRSKRSDS